MNALSHGRRIKRAPAGPRDPEIEKLHTDHTAGMSCLPPIQTIGVLMPINEVDLATLSEADVIKLRIENRAWSKTIRLCMAALVNRRMANQISFEEYAASRKAAKDERAECDRTMAMLGG